MRCRVEYALRFECRLKRPSKKGSSHAQTDSLCDDCSLLLASCAERGHMLEWYALNWHLPRPSCPILCESSVSGDVLHRHHGVLRAWLCRTWISGKCMAVAACVAGRH